MLGLDIMNTDFSDDYKIARVLYINRELESIPKLRRGGNNVVRLYDTRGHVMKTYNLSKPSNLIQGELADKREALIIERKRLTASLRLSPSEHHIQISAGYKLTKNEWEQMRSQCNSSKIKGDLWFENLHMRSRFEINTAIILRSLGLEFKYEPELRIGNKIKYPDFVVYLPEFEICFIIECMGRIGDSGYDTDADNKLRFYMDNGFIPFRDFLVLGGSNDYIPTKDWVINAIISVVNSISSECVFPLGKEVQRQESVSFRLPPDIELLLSNSWEV